MSPIYDRIRADIVTAMRTYDKATTTALRTAVSSIKMVELESDKPIDDAIVVTLLRRMVKNLHESKAQFEKGLRPELAAEAAAEIKLLEKYLPPPLEAAKLDALIDAAIAETGAQSARDMGKVIGALKKRPEAALIDFADVGKRVLARLP
jgi:uncharacterized protein YqeY